MNNAINLVDSVGLNACDKRGDIEVDDVELLFTMFTARKLTVRSPTAAIKKFISSWAKGRLRDAIARRNAIYRAWRAASGTAKSLAQKMGLAATAVSSVRLLLDEVEMKVDFRCCACTEEKELDWYRLSAGAKRSDVDLNLEWLDDARQVPDLVVDVMTEAARNVVTECRRCVAWFCRGQ